MAAKTNSTLRRVLRELQALRVRIDKQILIIQRVTQSPVSRRPPVKKKNKTVKKTSRPRLVGYALDRQNLLKGNPGRKSR